MKTLRLLISVIMFALSMHGWSFSFVVDGIKYSVNTNNISVSVESYDYTGDIVIPRTVTYTGQNFSVTSIGNAAFGGCSGLTSVTIPSSVTSIGYGAFYY